MILIQLFLLVILVYFLGRVHGYREALEETNTKRHTSSKIEAGREQRDGCSCCFTHDLERHWCPNCLKKLNGGI